MSKRILLVEDEEELQMVLRGHLRSEGYSVISAGDGEIGFQTATSQPFDLMILDNILPRRRGLELCRDIRRTGLRTPILILTACRATEDLIACFKAGADACVAKPFDMMELSARIEALLRRMPAVGSNAHHAAPPSAISTLRSGRAQPERANKQSVNFPRNAEPPGEPLDDHNAQPARAEKLGTTLSEIAPSCRRMPDKERQTPRSDDNAFLCSIADGLIEVLGGVLAALRSLGRRGEKEI